jgi:hypothetical protein
VLSGIVRWGSSLVSLWGGRVAMHGLVLALQYFTSIGLHLSINI